MARDSLARQPQLATLDFHLESAGVPVPGAGVKAEGPQVETVLKLLQRGHGQETGIK